MMKNNVQIFQEIKEKKFDFSSYEKHEIADLLLSHIGDKDSYVRDDLVYEILAHLFMDNYFNEEELTIYFNRLVSHEFMLYDLENKDEYSILKRSFSILQLVVLVYIHRRDQIIDQQIIKDLLGVFSDYIVEEKILTGYDKEVGWIHVVAHSADLFGQLFQVQSFDKDDLIIMLHVIAKLVKQKEIYYAFNEDERLVSAIIKGINRNILTVEEMKKWINQFQIDEYPHELPQKVFYKNNVKAFLNSLYFSCLNEGYNKQLTDQILEILKKNKKH